MACLDCQVPKETWVPWDLLDLMEDPVAPVDPARQVLKVNPDSQVGMGLLAVLVVKEKGATLASRDLQEAAHHHRP